MAKFQLQLFGAPRAEGHTKASRSSVLRLAMRRLDVVDAGAEHAHALEAM